MQYLDLNTNLSEEDIALKENANKFAKEVMRPVAKQLDSMEPEAVIAPNSPFWDFMRKVFHLGYHKVAMPEEYGGGNLSPLQQAIVFEELSWGSFGLAMSIYGGLFATLPIMFRNQELIEKFTIPYCECSDATVIGCWAITEPDHGSDTLMTYYPSFHEPNIKAQCRAHLEGDTWVIQGSKSAWVSRGTIATRIALFCQVEPSMGHAGSAIFIFPSDLPGVTKGKPLNKLGARELNQGEIYFDDVRIPKEYMLVGPGKYEQALENVLCGTTTLVAVLSTGLARAAFEEAISYAKERVQGGKKLIEHPNIQHALFNMFSKVEASRQISRAAYIYNRTAVHPSLEHGVAAKIYASHVALEVANEAIQILGGNGMAKEYLTEKLFRDARTTLLCDGSNDILAIAAGNRIGQSLR